MEFKKGDTEKHTTKKPYLVWQRGFHAATGSTIHANDIHEAVNLWAAEFDGTAPANCRLPIMLGNQIEVYASPLYSVELDTPLYDMKLNPKLFVTTGEMVPVYRARLVVQP